MPVTLYSDIMTAPNLRFSTHPNKVSSFYRPSKMTEDIRGHILLSLESHRLLRAQKQRSHKRGNKRDSQDARRKELRDSVSFSSSLFEKGKAALCRLG